MCDQLCVIMKADKKKNKVSVNINNSLTII